MELNFYKFSFANVFSFYHVMFESELNNCCLLFCSDLGYKVYVYVGALHHGVIKNESINLFTCLSFCSCLVIASLRLFWLFESSELLESVCFELAEPKQPIADQGVHQQAADDAPSGDVSGDSVPRASPFLASIV